MELSNNPVTLYQQGFTIKTISIILKENPEEIKKIVSTYNLIHKIFTEEEIPYMKFLNENGVSVKMLGKIYNIDKRRIPKFFKPIMNHKLIKFNENIFDNIDTEEKAYWFGFICGDGSVHKNKLTILLNSIDREHLIKFCKFINLDIINVRNSIKCNRNYSSISITSKNLTDKLKSYGCIENKTFLLKWPEWLKDNKLIIAFIRGEFDADGSIHHSAKKHKGNLEWRFNICGTYNMVSNIMIFINSKLNLICSIEHHNKKNNDNYKIVKSGNKSVNYIIKFLYEDANIYLDRKYEKHLVLLKQIKNKKNINKL